MCLWHSYSLYVQHADDCRCTITLPKQNSDSAYPLKLHFCPALVKPLLSKVLTGIVVSTVSVLNIKYHLMILTGVGWGWPM